MSVEIQWIDQCPTTGEKRFVCCERFAREWKFKIRYRRREEWHQNTVPTREMWEELLDAIERRYHRREGVSEDDLRYVKQKLQQMKDRQASAQARELKSTPVADTPGSPNTTETEAP